MLLLLPLLLTLPLLPPPFSAPASSLPPALLLLLPSAGLSLCLAYAPAPLHTLPFQPAPSLLRICDR